MTGKLKLKTCADTLKTNNGVTNEGEIKSDEWTR